MSSVSFLATFPTWAPSIHRIAWINISLVQNFIFKKKKMSNTLRENRLNTPTASQSVKYPVLLCTQLLCASLYSCYHVVGKLRFLWFDWFKPFQATITKGCTINCNKKQKTINLKQLTNEVLASNPPLDNTPTKTVWLHWQSSRWSNPVTYVVQNTVIIHGKWFYHFKEAGRCSNLVLLLHSNPSKHVPTGKMLVSKEQQHSDPFSWHLSWPIRIFHVMWTANSSQQESVLKRRALISSVASYSQDMLLKYKSRNSMQKGILHM